MKYNDHVQVIHGFYRGVFAVVIARHWFGLAYEVCIEKAHRDYNYPWHTVWRWNLRRTP